MLYYKNLSAVAFAAACDTAGGVHTKAVAPASAPLRVGSSGMDGGDDAETDISLVSSRKNRDAETKLAAQAGFLDRSLPENWQSSAKRIIQPDLDTSLLDRAGKLPTSLRLARGEDLQTLLTSPEWGMRRNWRYEWQSFDTISNSSEPQFKYGETSLMGPKTTCQLDRFVKIQYAHMPNGLNFGMTDATTLKFEIHNLFPKKLNPAWTSAQTAANLVYMFLGNPTAVTGTAEPWVFSRELAVINAVTHLKNPKLETLTLTRVNVQNPISEYAIWRLSDVTRSLAPDHSNVLLATPNGLSCLNFVWALNKWLELAHQNFRFDTGKPTCKVNKMKNEIEFSCDFPREKNENLEQARKRFNTLN